MIEAQASLEAFKQIQETHTMLRKEFDHKQEQERLFQITRVQHWLGAINSEFRHEDVVHRRHQGTGHWLLGNERFKNWFSPEQCIDPLLWLHGIPGAGKPTCSKLIHPA